MAVGDVAAIIQCLAGQNLSQKPGQVLHINQDLI